MDDISSEELDELIHEIKNNEATIINNNGKEAQLRYLTQLGYTYSDILKVLE